MGQYLRIHHENPQARLIARAVQIARDGGVIVYPTDSCYALGCRLGDKVALDRIKRLRGISDPHQFTLVCRDLSEIATYAKVENSAYRLLRARTPGPYTFILTATREVPRRVQDKRRTIGIRVPDHPVLQRLLEALGEPLMSSTLQLPGDDYPLCDPVEIRERLESQVDLIIDGGNCGLEPTTVVDLSGDAPRLERIGKGDPAGLE